MLVTLGMIWMFVACAAVASADVYVVDETALFRVTSAGSLSTVFSGLPFSSPRGVAVDFDGTILVADFGAGAVFKVTTAGALTTVHSGPPFMTPRGLALEASGALLVTDPGANALFRVNPTNPSGILADPGGNLVVTDGSGAIFLVPPVTGEVATVKSGAPFNNPRSIAWVPSPMNGFWILASGGSAGVILQVQDILGIGDPFPFTTLVTILDGFGMVSPAWRWAGGHLTGPGLTQMQGLLFSASAISGKTYSLTQGATSSNGNMTHFILVPR